MCLFSGPVTFVANTSIFARRDGDRQVLVYEMSVGFASDVAMILPVPVAPGAGEDALSFVDLEGYPEFFRHLASAFPAEEALALGPSRSRPRAPQPAPLKVHDVGSFEASYVPTANDFARLDLRFRLSEEAWSVLAPRYATWGFAVFKLRGGGLVEGLVGARRAPKLHPMAFSFPSRDPRLFFPTVHVHDGRFHAKATFDHTLYYQHPRAPNGPEIDTFGGDAVSWAKPKQTYAGMLDTTRSVVRRTLRGSQPNVDTWIEL